MEEGRREASLDEERERERERAKRDIPKSDTTEQGKNKLK